MVFSAVWADCISEEEFTSLFDYWYKYCDGELNVYVWQTRFDKYGGIRKDYAITRTKRFRVQLSNRIIELVSSIFSRTCFTELLHSRGNCFQKTEKHSVYSLWHQQQFVQVSKDFFPSMNCEWFFFRGGSWRFFFVRSFNVVRKQQQHKAIQNWVKIFENWYTYNKFGCNSTAGNNEFCMRRFFSAIRIFHDRPVWRISVRFSHRSEATQHKINFVKNCAQWGLNSQPPDHQSHALPTELGRNLLGISEISFLLFHAPCWTLFISRIHRAWLYKGLNDSHPQSNSDLVQLAEHGPDDPQVVSSNLTGGNFWRNLFCSV